MDIYYNSMVEGGYNQSTSDFMSALSSQSNLDSTFNLIALDWPAKPSAEQNYTQYKQELASQIPQGTFGSYDITTLEYTHEQNEINAIVYCSLESDASIGSFSAIMLE